MFWLEQIIGFIALVITGVSFYQNKKDKVLILLIIANILYSLQYLLLSAFSACLVYLIFTFQLGVFYYDDKNKHKSIGYLLLFVICYIIIGIFTYDGVISLIPVVTSIIYAYSVWQNNLNLFRIIAFVVPLLLIVYNVYVGAYINIFASLLEASVAFVAITKKNFHAF